MGELLGEIPQSFGEAEQAMREAEQAFRQGDPDAAGEAMGRALEQLQNGNRIRGNAGKKGLTLTAIKQSAVMTAGVTRLAAKILDKDGWMKARLKSQMPKRCKNPGISWRGIASPRC